MKEIKAKFVSVEMDSCGTRGYVVFNVNDADYNVGVKTYKLYNKGNSILVDEEITHLSTDKKFKLDEWELISGSKINFNSVKMGYARVAIGFLKGLEDMRIITETETYNSNITHSTLIELKYLMRNAKFTITSLEDYLKQNYGKSVNIKCDKTVKDSNGKSHTFNYTISSVVNNNRWNPSVTFELYSNNRYKVLQGRPKKIETVVRKIQDNVDIELSSINSKLRSKKEGEDRFTRMNETFDNKLKIESSYNYRTNSSRDVYTLSSIFNVSDARDSKFYISNITGAYSKDQVLRVLSILEEV